MKQPLSIVLDEVDCRIRTRPDTGEGGNIDDTRSLDVVGCHMIGGRRRLGIRGAGAVAETAYDLASVGRTASGMVGAGKEA